MSRGETGTLDLNTREQGTDNDQTGNVRALVAQELRRTWRSYVATAVGNLFFGMFAASLFWTVVRPNGTSNLEQWSFETDFIFVILVSLLSLNWISRNYATVWEDPFSKWLGFLRTLPVPVRSIVSARALVMVGVAVLMSGVFFLPFYALNSLNDPVFTEAVPLLEYLWFIGVWMGYAFLLGSLHLYLELSVRGKTIFLVQGVLLVIMFVVLSVLTGVGIHIVWGSFWLVQMYGPIPAIVVVAIGLLSLALGQQAMARRLQTRSFPS